MGIRTSSLPNLANPSSNTILVGINVVNETPNNSVKITVANLKSFIVVEPWLSANQSFVKANASYDTANSSSAYANSSFIQANSAYIKTNSVYNLANTTANTLSNTDVKLSSSYNFSNTLYGYSNVIHEAANSGIQLAANSFIQANSAYNKANDAYDYTSSVDSVLWVVYEKANTVEQLAQVSNTNAIIAYDTAQSALSDAQNASEVALHALTTANDALYISANTEIKLYSAYNLANDTFDALQSELSSYPIINVKRMGMIGDGSIDETANLQYIIDQFENTTIFIPSGVYRISSVNLKPGICLKGDGCNSTILLSETNDYSMIQYHKTDLETNDDNITIVDIGFKANGTINCSSITISGNSNASLCKNIKITNIKIDAEYGYDFVYGVHISNSKNIILSSIFSANCGNDVLLDNCVKGLVTNNVLDSGIANNIVEVGGCDKNVISSNITKKRINNIGPNTIKVNNIENASE